MVERDGNALQKADRNIAFAGFELGKIARRHTGNLRQHAARNTFAFARLTHAFTDAANERRNRVIDRSLRPAGLGFAPKVRDFAHVSPLCVLYCNTYDVRRFLAICFGITRL